MTQKERHFCPAQILNRAAEIYQKRWKDFTLLTLLAFLIGSLASVGVNFNPETGEVSRTGIGVIAQLFSWLAMIYYGIAYTRFSLKVIDGKEVSVDRFFHEVESVRHFVHYLITRFLAKFLTSLILLLPLIFTFFFVLLLKNVPSLGATLLVIVSIIFVAIALLYSPSFIFAPFAVAERRAEIFESIKLSWNIVRGARVRLLVLGVFILLLNIIGILAFLVGLLVTIPISSIALFIAYRELLREKHFLHEKKHHEAE